MCVGTVQLVMSSQQQDRTVSAFQQVGSWLVTDVVRWRGWVGREVLPGSDRPASFPFCHALSGLFMCASVLCRYGNWACLVPAALRGGPQIVRDYSCR